MLFGTTEMIGWLYDGMTSLSTLLNFLTNATGLVYVIPIVVGVSMLGHLYRVVFGHGGISDGVSALSDVYNPPGTPGEWAKLEENARRRNGWKG